METKKKKKLMRAVWYDSYGGGPADLKQAEAPIPRPRKFEVLLKVEAAAINPLDYKFQKGYMRPFFPRKLPHIPATDVAGEVVEVGAAVTKLKVGDKVVAFLSVSTGGGLSEFATASEKLTVLRPPEVTATDGAALPMAGLSAHQALTQSAGLKLDGTDLPKNILVTAASSGVGHYAIQLAKLANAHVTATCGARNIDLIKSLGADEVLDYKTPEGASLKSPFGLKYDIVVHCATGIDWSVFEPNLSSRGLVVDLTPRFGTIVLSGFQKVTFSKKRLVPMLVSPKVENLEFLVELMKNEKLKTVIDSKHKLSNVADAWTKCVDGHATGKIVVEI